jgi:cytochrome c-type biogenesis protein CcmH
MGAEQAYVFDDPAQQKLFLELTKELRCPMCQNQNIADSDAMIAHDLRRKVYELLQQGYSREEVVDYMKQRYGDFVSYQPPVTPVTIWLWLIPVLFVLAAVVFVVIRQRSSGQTIDPQQLAKADSILEKEE